MEKEQIEIISAEIIKEIMKKKNGFFSQLKEGYLSIDDIWVDLRIEVEKRNIELEMLKSIVLKEEILILEIERAIKNFLEREVLKSFNENFKDQEKEKWKNKIGIK